MQSIDQESLLFEHDRKIWNNFHPLAFLEGPLLPQHSSNNIIYMAFRSKAKNVPKNHILYSHNVARS